MLMVTISHQLTQNVGHLYNFYSLISTHWNPCLNDIDVTSTSFSGCDFIFHSFTYSTTHNIPVHFKTRQIVISVSLTHTLLNDKILCTYLNKTRKSKYFVKAKNLKLVKKAVFSQEENSLYHIFQSFKQWKTRKNS